MANDVVAISRDKFQIIRGKIFYNFIPLWSCGSFNLDGYEFGYYDPDKTEYHDDPKYYMLTCKDNLGDNFHFGRWDNKEELLDWLENPYVYGLYDKTNKLVDIQPTGHDARFCMFMDKGETIKSSKRLHRDTVLSKNFIKKNNKLLFK